MSNLSQTISCPLCKKSAIELYASAKDVEYFSSDETYDYFECKSCEILFIHPVPIDKLGLIYPPNYYSVQESKESLAFRIKNYLDKKFFKKILEGIEGSNLSILDVGGGTGWLLNKIKEYEPRAKFTQVVDISVEAEGTARKFHHEYFCGTIEQFQTARKFDLILVLNLIEHVEDPLSTLQNCRELLSERGVIILKTPNYFSFDARLFRNKNWGGYHCPRHWTIFKRESFARLSNNAGLIVKKSYYTQGAPFWTVNILNGFHSKGLIRIGKDRPLVYHPLFGPISILFALFDYLRRPFAPLSQMFFILTK